MIPGMIQQKIQREHDILLFQKNGGQNDGGEKN